MRRANPYLLATAVACVAGLAPLVLGPYGLGVAFSLLTVIGLAQAWNLVAGFGGQLSLGHAAFVGTGAYVSAVLLIHTGMPMIPAVLAAGLGATVLAGISAVALLRLRGAYFAIGSLALAQAALAWMLTWEATGGTQGLNLPFDVLPEPATLYLLALATTLLVTVAAIWITRSDFGLRLMAVRDDEDAATGLGVSGFAVKARALCLSAFFAGVIGALLALQQISVEPNSAFAFAFVVNMTVMTMVGGAGTVMGPIVGATLVYYGITKTFEDYAEASSVITAVLLIVVIRLFPMGIWPAMRDAVPAAVARRAARRSRRATSAEASS